MASFLIQCTQINLHRSKDASAILQRGMARMHTGISLVQEPWVGKNAIRGLGGLSCFRDPDAVRPRACIVTKGISATPLLDLCSPDLAVVLVNAVGDRKVVFASAYLPYENGENPPWETRRLVEYCSGRGLPLVLGCDANSHHIVWGSTDNNARGVKLFEYLMTTDLEILNVGREPTFRNAIRAEVIDITLCSGSLVNEVRNWRVSQEPSLSDHAQIRFEVVSGSVSRHQEFFRNPRKTDWGKYREELSVRLQGISRDIGDIHTLERAAAALSEGVREAFEASSRLMPVPTRGGVCWWSAGLERLKRANIKAKRRADRRKRPEDWAAFRTSRDNYRAAVRKAKEDSWRGFCSTIEGGAQTARLDKILAKSPLSVPGVLRLPSGEYTQSEEETLRLLMSAHFPSFVEGGEVAGNECGGGGRRWQGRQLREHRRLAAGIASKGRIEWAISSFGPYKTPGPDGIYPVLLQKAADLIMAPLIKIIRASFVLGHVPRAWQGTRVVFIPKAGRVGYVSPKDYRPISLTSFFLKTAERLLDRYIRDTVLTRHPLNRAQHAYLAGCSTETALLEAVGYIEQQLESKGFAVGTFIDIEGAFSHASKETIRAAMERREVPPFIVAWTEHMLSNRQTSVAREGASISGTVGSGCPQGGVLSPLLWCLVVDDLLELLTNMGLKVVGYADDVLIIARGPHLEVLKEISQGALNALGGWCRRVGLSVNAGKTEVLVFTRKYKYDKTCGLTLGGRPVKVVEEAKYLGVILDKRLLWDKHLESKCGRFRGGLWQLRRAIGSHWGLQPSAVKWMFDMILLPRLTYAAVVWAGRMSLKTARERLETLRGMTVRAITGAVGSAPTAALGYLTGVDPLHLRITSEAAYALIRLREGWGRSGAWASAYARLPSSLRSRLGQVGVADWTPTRYLFDKRYRISLPTRLDWQEGKVDLPSGEVWYTDGSKGNGGSGSGVYQRRQGRGSFASLGKDATVFQAEIMAIILCAHRVLESPGRGSVVICSDSKSSLQALQGFTTKSKLVLECHEILCRIGLERSITLTWIPAHRGYHGNEIADRLAKLGAGQKPVGPEPVIGISISVVRTEIRKWLRQEALSFWRESEGCVQSKALLGTEDPEKGRRYGLYDLNRRMAKVLVGILTGHGVLKYWEHKVGLSGSPLCSFCGAENETTVHVLCQCPARVYRRWRLSGAALWTIEEIAGLRAPQVLSKWRAVMGS